MGSKRSLDEYRRKRDFGRTPEPSGGGEGERGARFVVQQHAASSMHYDFRLEVDGVLKSWAVPKGPSADPRDKRLAIMTEDHPLDYIDFEGVIPKGQYGAGAVIVWDCGTYRDLGAAGERPIAERIEAGHVTFALQGVKLRGGYALTRIGKDADADWLLVKMRDEWAVADTDLVRAAPASVVSGRTVDEVASDEGRAD